MSETERRKAILITEGVPDRFQSLLEMGVLPAGTWKIIVDSKEEARTQLEADDGIVFIGLGSGIFTRSEGLNRMNGLSFPHQPPAEDNSPVPMQPDMRLV